MKYQDAFLTIASNDLEQAIAFYSQLLNQKPQPYIPNVYAEFALKSMRLGIFQPKTDHQTEFNNSRYSSMSICLEVDNLENAIEHLKAMNCHIAEEITIASHGREIYAYDPMQNRLILHQSN